MHRSRIENRDTVWFEDSGGPNEPCIRWGSRSPWEGAILRGKGRPIVKYRDTLRSGPYAKIVNISPVVVCWSYSRKADFVQIRYMGPITLSYIFIFIY